MPYDPLFLYKNAGTNLYVSRHEQAFVQETFHTVVYFPSLHFFLHCHLRKLKVQNICIELHGTSLYT